jgi:hypothetical protein
MHEVVLSLAVLVFVVADAWGAFSGFGSALRPIVARAPVMRSVHPGNQFTPAGAGHSTAMPVPTAGLPSCASFRCRSRRMRYAR